MIKARAFAALLLVAPLLGGCGSWGMSRLLGDSKSNDLDTGVAQGQNLAMPPDLQLRAPAEGAAPEPANTASLSSGDYEEPIADTGDGIAAEPLAGGRKPATVSPGQTGDNYDKYGISKTHADGRPKTREELIEELKAAQLAEKRKKNPNYGTIWNAGELFSDD